MSAIQTFLHVRSGPRGLCWSKLLTTNTNTMCPHSNSVCMLRQSPSNGSCMCEFSEGRLHVSVCAMRLLYPKEGRCLHQPAQNSKLPPAQGKVRCQQSPRIPGAHCVQNSAAGSKCGARGTTGQLPRAWRCFDAKQRSRQRVVRIPSSQPSCRC